MKTELTYHKPGSTEAKECMKKNNLLYASDGLPLASVYFVLGDPPSLADEYFNDEQEKAERMEKIAHALVPLVEKEDDKGIEGLFRQNTDLLVEITEFEIAAMLNEVCNSIDDFVGCDKAKLLIEALQTVDEDRFGSGPVPTHYTYNDCDSYAGQHDLQITWNQDGDIYPGDVPLVFVQIHPGGDARNMASGMFYVLEGLDEFTNIFDTLGAYEHDLGSTAEIPTKFPFEEWLQKEFPGSWERVYREDVKVGKDKWAKKETFDRYDITNEGMCQVHLSPESYYGASADSYRCYEPFDRGEFWDWCPTGEIIGEMRSQVGVSATPWKPVEFQYSTGGYFKWVGPLPGTDEWKEMLAKLELEEIEPPKIEDPNQKKMPFEEE